MTEERIFGKDCKNLDTVNNFISHIYLCVTVSGRTNQKGCPLFLDSPANTLGSFVIGILTPLKKYILAIPWLKASHWRQTDTGIHLALRTAFCGSLIIFASWNTISSMYPEKELYKSVITNSIIICC